MIERVTAALRLQTPAVAQQWLTQLHEYLHDGLINEPALYLRDTTNPRTGKHSIYADWAVEDRFRSIVQSELAPFVTVSGEESLDQETNFLDFRKSSNIHVLCDMIDGTDLLIRGFSNWCSAFIAFDPSSSKLLSSYVYVKGDNVDSLYCAHDLDSNVLVTDLLNVIYVDGPAPITGTASLERLQENSGRQIWKSVSENHRYKPAPKTTPLEHATVCIYGQKFGRAYHVADTLNIERIRTFFEPLENARLYNLAGNPMICRIVDGSVDLVVDFSGQAPHDVAPGAYIAMKGGAVMCDLRPHPVREDRRIRTEDLMENLLRPNAPENTLKYAICSSESLAAEFMDLCEAAGII